MGERQRGMPGETTCEFSSGGMDSTGGIGEADTLYCMAADDMNCGTGSIGGMGGMGSMSRRCAAGMGGIEGRAGGVDG